MTLLPPPRSQEADAGGLGLLLLSSCAEPSRAIIPTVKHPTARNATALFMVFPPKKLAPNIEANLPLKRNCNCRRSLKTHLGEFCLASPSLAKGSGVLRRSTVEASPGVRFVTDRVVRYFSLRLAGMLAGEPLLGNRRATSRPSSNACDPHVPNGLNRPQRTTADGRGASLCEEERPNSSRVWRIG